MRVDFVVKAEEFDTGESFDIELGAELFGFRLGAINFSNVKFVFVVSFIKFLPCWRYLFAMTTPWGVELYQPRLISFQSIGGPIDDLLIECLYSQMLNLFFSTSGEAYDTHDCNKY